MFYLISLKFFLQSIIYPLAQNHKKMLNTANTKSLNACGYQDQNGQKKDRKEEEQKNKKNKMSHVMCQVSYFTCQVSYVMVHGQQREAQINPFLNLVLSNSPMACSKKFNLNNSQR